MDTSGGGGETLRTLARQAREALDQLALSGDGCPLGADRFDWSADMLDDLARVAARIGEAANHLTGGDDDELARHAQALATAIVRRRNDALCPLRDAGRSAAG